MLLSNLRSRRAPLVALLASTGALLALSTLAAPLAAQRAPDDRRAVREWIERIAATGATPGLAVAVVRGDSVLVARGYGVADVATGQPVTDSTRFYIASTTKAFTALTASVLHARGTIRLDAPLRELLPGTALGEGLSAQAITLRDLLSMRHGIGDGPVVLRTAYTGEHTSAELLALLREHPPAPGGRAFRYSNIGYNIAGLALERRLRKPWQELVRETVLVPLAMRSTTARVSSLRPHEIAMPHDFREGQLARIALLKTDRTLHAAGGHYTTAADLARFLVAQMNGGRVPGASGLPSPAVTATHQQMVAQDRRFAFVQRTGWGLGWDIARYDSLRLLQRNGGFAGYYSHVSFMPDQRIGVAVLGNGGLDGAAAETIAQGVYDLLLRRGDPARLEALRDTVVAQVRRARESARTRAAAPPLPHPPAVYAGYFHNASLGSLALEGNGETVIVRIGDSWGVAHGVPGADGRPAPDAVGANVLGANQRFTVRFAEDGQSVREVELRGYVFRPTPLASGRGSGRR